MLRFIGKPLDPNDGATIKFDFAEIGAVHETDDVMYVGQFKNIPVLISSVALDELPEYDDPIDAGVPIAAQRAEYEALVSIDEEAITVAQWYAGVDVAAGPNDAMLLESGIDIGEGK